mmetsp:Transcript_20379/g.40063  ORF Transcript_20379/g.40063 Transcript_20379/m.40063 type:complete len:899 (+) Transcript_20379:876-3572(+)|eukprot:CAMPEP_0171501060 /NCGR_PEP_ID=MMETSP0958-20121227/9350_1 /TAXON_ID=87120 /ORGANISM="Aurantiochytrium limacinum, Strain ATCCMYA-1381" /LENGTH=898 /DNA_ID=CAMNT_0012035837 /DNA_START=780 /DNA_END=3476 /DNA_ORIENTATION=-
MNAAFVDAHLYTRRYQRNNKRSGLKNLRCFPLCSDEHKLRGFCGRPVYIEVDNPEHKRLRVFGEFVKLPNKGDAEPGLHIGDIVNKTQLTENMRTKTEQFNPWLEGESEDGAINSESNHARFVINKAKRGWHYGWVANKHTCESEHVLRAYVLEEVTASSLRVIMTHDTPSFTLFCRRRQRQNLDRLPAQLKMQLELQDESKRLHKAIPKSIPVAKDRPLELISPVLSMEKMTMLTAKQQQQQIPYGGILPKKRSSDGMMGTTNGLIPPPPSTLRIIKRARTTEEDPLFTDDYDISVIGPDPDNVFDNMIKCEDPGMPHDVPSVPSPVMGNNHSSGLMLDMDALTKPIARSNNRPTSGHGLPAAPGSPVGVVVPPTTLEQRRTLLYHVLRSLLRLDIKSCVPLGQLAAENNNILLGNDAASVASVDDFSKSISDCMDFFSSNSSSMSDDADGSTLQGSADYGSIGGDLASLNDFQPFDLDFSVLDHAEAESGSSLKFVDIMKDFAYFLIDEQDFTSTIKSALCGASLDCDSSSHSSLALSILLDLLCKFLMRYRISIDELYFLFKTQVWDFKDGANNGTAVNNKGMSLSWNGAAADPMRPSAEAERSFNANIMHYTNTFKTMAATAARTAQRSASVNGNRHQQKYGEHQSPRSVFDLDNTAANSPYGNNTPRTDIFGPMMPPIGPKDCGAEMLLSLSNQLAFVPNQDPRNDFTGEYIRPPETLNVLESIREAMGVPFILRRMVRHMETYVKITHCPGAIDTQSYAKLFSSGFQRYILDGKEHRWDVPPPLPMERPQTHATYIATLKDGCLAICIKYSKRKRLIRESRKSPCGTRLDSVVRFQFRDDTNSPWITKLCSKTCAIEKSMYEDRESVGAKESAGDDLVSWLPTPCEFSMSLY